MTDHALESPVTDASRDAPIVRLRRDAHDRLTDGKHVYWNDGRLVRWSRYASMADWPDDGLGVVSHGGARTLRAAIEHAHRCEEMRASVLAEVAE